jgi:PST family polysaccharide transporter
MISRSIGADLPVTSPRATDRPRPAHTYAQILKSTVVIGGSSAVNIVVGVVRNKAMALLLGPAGVGLIGLYTSVQELTFSLAGMGIQSSGVRQIAEAVGSDDVHRVARTARVLKRVAVVLGVMGALVLAAFAAPISQLTFGTRSNAAGVALLGLAVLCRLVSAGQSALIQGMRRISDLASQNVLAAVLGTSVAIALVWVFREGGIVPSLIGVWAAMLFSSWYFSRRIQIAPGSVTLSDVWHESAALLKLGTAFMSSAFLTMGAAYVIRIIVLRSQGMEGAGLYQSAWSIGGLYVGFILQAMGADFYPRLTAVHRDNVECTRLVNEQAQISLLLAGPGVMATLTLAPLVLSLFYSAQFAGAVVLLRWICLGMMMRVVAWPMGFIVLAKGAQQIYFFTEIAAAVVHVGLAWLLIPIVGINGAGMAFFGLYVWHSVLIYAVVRRLCTFEWSASSLTLGLIFLPLTAVVFLSTYVLAGWAAAALGIAAAVGSGIYSLRRLLALVPHESLPAPVRGLVASFGLGGPSHS